MGVKSSFTSNIVSWATKKVETMQDVALEMATDVDRLAKINAPYDKGNLVNSGRIVPVKNGYNSATIDEVPFIVRRVNLSQRCEV